MKIQATLIKKPHWNRVRIRRKKESGSAGFAAFLPLLGGLCAGVLVQAFFFSGTEPGLAEKLTTCFHTQDVSFFVMLACFLLPSVGLGLLILYLGASPVGAPGIALLLFLRGMGLGAVASYLASLGKPGLSFYYACLFPAKALQLCGLFLISKRAMLLSGYYKSCLKRDSFHAEPMLRTYLSACLPGLLLLLCSAAADVFLFWKISPAFCSLVC